MPEGVAEIATQPNMLRMKDGRSETTLAGLKAGSEASGANLRAHHRLQRHSCGRQDEREDSIFVCIAADWDRDRRLGGGAWHAMAMGGLRAPNGREM